MSFFLTLLFAFAATPFESTTDRAFAAAHNNDWSTAATALDQAASEDPTIFDANNFHYLRGRVAENQGDFRRALEEFKQIGSSNPLFAAASWHAARAAAKLHDDAAVMELLALLPR